MVLSFLFLLWICCGRAQDYVETSDSTREISQGGHNEPTAIENKQFCEGCVTTLKIDVEGISPLIEAAIKDIESERIRKQVLLELINLERQIVNGVKFSIAFKIGSTTCERDAEVSLAGCPVDVETDPEYCRVDFLQKPWLSKDKYVIYNNCTSKSYVYPEIETAETTTKSQELPPERVASIESQIIPEGDFFETIYDNGEVETNNLGSDNYYRGAEEDDYYEPEEKLRRVERDLNTSEDSKSNDTSVGSSEEKLRRTVRDLNTSEESRSNDTSSSEEHRRVPRGTKDSRAQSSLEKNDEKNDVSLDTLIKKNKNGGKSLSTHEDSITRHKRGADSSSSSSSSSSDDDNGNDNNINDKDNKKSKKGSLKKNDNDKNGNDDNDTSSSSSSDDDNGNNNNKHRRKRAADLDRLSEQILLRNLGKYVTALYDSEDEDNLRQIPLSVVKTKKSIIEGLVYDLKIKIVTTDCDENKDILNSNNLLTYEPITNSCEETSLPNSAKLCKVKIYIPESYSNPKLLDSRCHTYSDGRIKRQIPGGIQTASVDAPEIIDLAESTLRLLDSESGHPNKYKIVKIREASTQVVSGSLTKIKADIVVSDCPKTDPKHPKLCGAQTGASPKTCDIKIWDQPWLPQGRQTTVKCGGDTQKFRSKRDLGDALHVSPHAIIYTAETVHLLDDQTDYLVKLKPVRILNAIKQGEKDQYYTINIILGLSQCLKDSDMDVMKCPLDPHYHLTKCKILISHDIDKTHRGIERSIRCQNGLRGNFGHPPLVREKRQVGAPVPESVSDPTVINLTQSALRQFDSESPHSNKYKIIQIQDVTKQVVSGILYKITAEIILSDCPKTEPTDPNVCAPAKEADPQVCQIEVWSRPWLKVGSTETTVNCGGRVSKFRSRRSVGDSSFLDGSDDLKAKLSFVDFTNKYDVVYSSPDEARRRFKIFKSNLNRINLFNDVELGTAKYGVTRFADLTREEFKKKYLGLRVEKQAENEIPFPPAEIPDIELPKEFDWRDKGAVTAVKDQGSCGSCWAFSTTGNVEGQYAIKHGKLLEFSEQELVDCDTYDEGCGGGLMDNAYRAIEKLGGLELESDYPYDAKNEKCHFNKTMVKAELTGALNISQNEDDMAKWLTVNGPIAIAINANAMQFYVGGVSHPWKFLCNPKSLDHGVLIVGYGVHSYPNFNKTLPYWVVKNSWGKRWGEQGYYKVYRGDGTCGVNQTPSSGVVA